MLEFETTNGYKTQISDEDFDMILCYSWFYDKSRNEIICNNNRYKNKKLHLMIASKMGLTGESVDHKDRNRFNNQRENLREATHTQQEHNKPKCKNKSSQYKGVYYHKKQNMWHAGITKDKMQIHLGRFKLEEEAARAYDNAAKVYFGEFACLNFPE